MKKIFTAFMAIALLMAAAPKSDAQIGFSAGVGISVAPPALPVYTQPVCPGDGYIWTPGYWAYGDDGYYWVDGEWVLAPEIGFLWTPPYWGFYNGFYSFHAGYWGPTIGFYGGINYGFGYTGHGYWGGRWEGGRFMYNTAISHVNIYNVHNTYVDRNVVVNNYSHTSFNGAGGISDRPNGEEQRAANERHIGATSAQVNRQTAASANRGNFANVNHGSPAGTGLRRVNGNATVREGEGQNAGGRYNAANGANRAYSPNTNGYNRPAYNNQASAQRYNTPTQRYSQPAQHYSQPAQHYSQPAQHYSQPAQHYSAPAQHYSAPAQHYSAPAQHYSAPAQHYSGGGGRRR